MSAWVRWFVFDTPFDDLQSRSQRVRKLVTFRVVALTAAFAATLHIATHIWVHHTMLPQSMSVVQWALHNIRDSTNKIRPLVLNHQKVLDIALEAVAHLSKGSILGHQNILVFLWVRIVIRLAAPRWAWLVILQLRLMVCKVVGTLCLAGYLCLRQFHLLHLYPLLERIDEFAFVGNEFLVSRISLEELEVWCAVVFGVFLRVVAALYGRIARLWFACWARYFTHVLHPFLQLFKFPLVLFKCVQLLSAM